MSERRVAIIGFGFSGLMVAANLVRAGDANTTLYIIAEDLRGLGLAYATTNPQHLLNVTADRMSAYADAPNHLLEWLVSPTAAAAKKQLGLSAEYNAGSFIPRALYGQYLQSIWQETQALAAQKQLHLKLVEATATRIAPCEPMAVQTARGDAIAVDAVVLASGHADKPLLTHLPARVMIQNPWGAGCAGRRAALGRAGDALGSGLTAVDTLLSLRDAGYLGPVIAVSRNGRMPEPHIRNQPPFVFDMAALLAAHSPASIFKIAAQQSEGSWGLAAGDGCAAPAHADAVAAIFGGAAKTVFCAGLRRSGMCIATAWRRKFMPALRMKLPWRIARAGEQTDGRAHGRGGLRDGHHHAGRQYGTLLPLAHHPLRGQEMNLAKNPTTLIKQALADGVMEPHGNGIGLAADPAQRVWAACYPNLYAVGSLLTGQLLESTAVPELRAQAAAVAAAINAA